MPWGTSLLQVRERSERERTASVPRYIWDCVLAGREYVSSRHFALVKRFGCPASRVLRVDHSSGGNSKDRQTNHQVRFLLTKIRILGTQLVAR